MKRFLYATISALLLSGCSAAYWSSPSFSGDDMYDIANPVEKQTSKYRVPVPQQEYTYTPYQRPESYYQYQYVGDGEVAESEVSVETKYISSTYDVWNEPSVETYIYVESVPQFSYYNSLYYSPFYHYPFYYDPFWRYPYYVRHRPIRPIYTKPRPRQNIVQIPSSRLSPSSSSRSSSSTSRSTTSSSSKSRSTPSTVTRSSLKSSTSNSSTSNSSTSSRSSSSTKSSR